MQRLGLNLVLVGGGHAHAEVLRRLALRPVHGVALHVVSPQPRASYSGMVPGWLAGRWGFDALSLDIEALARQAGAHWLEQPVVAMDADARRLHLGDGRTLAYDLASVNIGSTLHPPAVPPAGRCLSLRPLDGLEQAWTALWQDPWLTGDSQPLAVTMVGGGAAGVEVMLAVCATLRRRLPQRTLLPVLVTRSAQLLPGMADGAARRSAAALQAAGVRVVYGVDAAQLLARPAAAPGLLLWAPGAQAHAWPARSGLAVDAGGWIRVDAQLRSRSHPEVFAVGDCASPEPALPKSGVVAVRQGPVLADNLRAALSGTPLRDYQPQRRWLALLATGDGAAIAAWGRWSSGGSLWGRLKDHIDQRFMARYRG